MKVHTSLLGNADAVEEEIHQHGLAAPDSSPEIDAPNRIGFAPGEASQEAGPLPLRVKFGNRLAEAQGQPVAVLLRRDATGPLRWRLRNA